MPTLDLWRSIGLGFAIVFGFLMGLLGYGQSGDAKEAILQGLICFAVLGFLVFMAHRISDEDS